MEWIYANIWWVVCGGLIVVELVTGTFFLLMLALGCAGGAVAAHLDLPITWQFVAAAVVGGAAVVFWYHRRSGRARPAPASSNPDAILDIGQAVDVDHWDVDLRVADSSPKDKYSAKVKYRGAEWQAGFIGTGTPAAGRFVIRAIEGSRLLLDH
ncbi:MAG: NfeD family protein [Myxococcales bacterium]|nr:NfeD family protein [Myxococcales bacterium]